MVDEIEALEVVIKRADQVSTGSQIAGLGTDFLKDIFKGHGEASYAAKLFDGLTDIFVESSQDRIRKAKKEALLHRKSIIQQIRQAKCVY